MSSGPVTTESGGSPRVVRFAGFEFDAGTGELRKHGLRIKLQGQPVGLLAMLIEHAGEVVTREELQKRLWPADTFVDFEHSLNAAVKRLRAALGDSADAPRFVETLPRKGYRFIAPVSYPIDNQPGVSVPFPAAAAPKRQLVSWRVSLLLLLAAIALAAGAGLWLRGIEYFWRSPIADARFETVTGLEGIEQTAAVSPDGHFVAFLSDRDGHMDVSVTQVGSGQFHNLTRGAFPGLVNPLVRTPEFSPDGSLVTFWVSKPGVSGGRGIGVWAVPTLGGESRPYLEGVAEFDWTHDGTRLVYHTPGPGDPMFASDGSRLSAGPPLFTAPSGLHCHFQLWSPDSKFVYFVHGALPDKLDIWRIASSGGQPERVTSHDGRVSYPVFLDRRTLMYLATDHDGSGPWLYSMDVERRIPHRLTPGPDRYNSLSATTDGRRLVVTRTSPKITLWRLPVAGASAQGGQAVRISLMTGAGFSPRLGPGYLLYVSSAGASESIWKLSGNSAAELWNGAGAQVFGGPSISSDGKDVAFSIRRQGRTLLYAMKADGTGARVIADSLDLEGAPSWAPDGQSITTAAADHGEPRLFRVPLDGSRPVLFLHEYSVAPVWSPDGRFVVYSGADIGTTFAVKAAAADAAAHPLPTLNLTRGARHIAFLPGGRSLLFLRGDIQHKNLWLLDLEDGAERQLTSLTPDFDVRDFDISPDGSEIVLERMEERSDVVMIDRQ